MSRESGIIGCLLTAGGISNFARKFSPYCCQAGFLTYGHRSSAPSHTTCTMDLCGIAPKYSYRIAQDSHLIPFSPALCGQRRCT